MVVTLGSTSSAKLNGEQQQTYSHGAASVSGRVGTRHPVRDGRVTYVWGLQRGSITADMMGSGTIYIG